MPPPLDPRTPLIDAPATVLDFWRWAYSDLLVNTTRSVFAEYLVGLALGVVDTPRVEWQSVDLYYGDHKIEVKASADCQSWAQARPSRISYRIRKARAWSPETGKSENWPTRTADIYVFCHYSERDRAQANVLHVPAWDFYVVRVAALNAEFAGAKSISLAAVRLIEARCKFQDLRATVDGALRRADAARA